MDALVAAARMAQIDLLEVHGRQWLALDEVVEATARRYHDPTGRAGLRGAWARHDDPGCRTLALSSDDAEPAAWLSSGRALQRVLLEATCSGA